MIWVLRVLLTLGGLTFIGGGADVLSADCPAVDFGGNRRTVTYECVAEGTDGAMSPGVAGGLMLLGGFGLLGLAWGPSIYRALNSNRTGDAAMPIQATSKTTNQRARVGSRSASSYISEIPKTAPVSYQLERLIELRSSQKISDADFQSAKAAMLGTRSASSYISEIPKTAPVSDQLERLIDLRSSQKISEADFQSAKAAMLGSTEEARPPPIGGATTTASPAAKPALSQRTAPPPLSQAPESALDPSPAIDHSAAERRSEAPRDEVVEALRQLKALHDEGILTDSEYESKRQRLADQL